MRRLGQTPSQTVGPFFGMKLKTSNVLAGGATSGQRIRIEGVVWDGDRHPIEDALIEIWQANSHGRYRHPADRRDLPLDEGFTGFGRAESEPGTGAYRFETIKPGRVPDARGRLQAPHISMVVFARGMLNHSFTRMYFADEEANRDDPVLARVAPERRLTLLARRIEAGPPPVYRFDVRFQGDDETVFFDV